MYKRQDRTLSAPGGAERVESLSDADRANEYLIFALRLREGASLDRFADLARTPLADGALKEVIELGLLEREGDRIRTTDRGVMMLNGVLRRLLADRGSA